MILKWIFILSNQINDVCVNALLNDEYAYFKVIKCLNFYGGKN